MVNVTHQRDKLTCTMRQDAQEEHTIPSVTFLSKVDNLSLIMRKCPTDPAEAKAMSVGERQGALRTGPSGTAVQLGPRTRNGKRMLVEVSET